MSYREDSPSDVRYGSGVNEVYTNGRTVRGVLVDSLDVEVAGAILQTSRSWIKEGCSLQPKLVGSLRRALGKSKMQTHQGSEQCADVYWGGEQHDLLKKSGTRLWFIMRRMKIALRILHDKPDRSYPHSPIISP